MKILEKYERCFIMWRDNQIFTGFGHEGINAIANAHVKIYGSSPNMSCTPCAIQATEAVYKYYYQNKCT